MYKLRDIVKVDARFQKSINLQLDMGNWDRINAYIPTRSSSNTLAKYIQNVCENTSEKSTILIGPYGKGKSHLLLVLLAIVSATGFDQISELCKKIANVNGELGEQIQKCVLRKKPMLPVIISATSGSLNQAFTLALHIALKRAKITDIELDSFYSEALRMIAMWKEDFLETYEQFLKKLEARHIDSISFINQLKKYDEETLQIFKEIYPDITAGNIFNPLVQTDVKEIYKEVNDMLCQRYGYGGIYIIFDEFSKFVEGHEKHTFSNDMAIIQDICELANKSKENQIHITFVAHKSIKEYGNYLPRDVINAFTGVEGRLKEYLFVVSSQNNYELVKSALGKEEQLFTEAIGNNKKIGKIIEESYHIPCFSATFKKEDYLQMVGLGCFPLAPLAVYALLRISEKVGQNERSIFTFLAGDEEYSVARIIRTCKGLDTIGLDAIYDYFQGLFKENTAFVQIHNEWLKSEYALSRTNVKEEQKIIKGLAIIHMINRPEEIAAIDSNLRLGLAMRDEYQLAMESLKEKNIVVWRSKSGVYTFKNNIGIDIEKEITKAISDQPQVLAIGQELKKVSELEYVLPKQHNQKYQMTRYFYYDFIKTSDFLNLKKSQYLFEDKFSDGRIVALVKENDLNEEAISAKVEELNDPRLIVLLPKSQFSEMKDLRKLIAVRKLKSSPEFLENNGVLEQELGLYEEDLIFEINRYLQNVFLPENGNCIVYRLKERYEGFANAIEYNRLLSKACEEYYGMAPKVNNELVNRQNLSAQITKARNRVVEVILNEKDYSEYQNGTSPEATIFRATLLKTGLLEEMVEKDEGSIKVLSIIQDFVASCSEKKKSFSELYDRLQGKDFGMRKGIMPIYIAKQLSTLSDTPVIYLKDREVEACAEILNNINDNPEDYFLYVEQETIQKDKYLSKLESLFLQDQSVEVTATKRGRLTNIIVSIQKWYRSLPQCTVIANLSEEEREKVPFYDQMIAFRNIFKKIDLNPRDILFEMIPDLFEKESSYDIYGETIQDIHEYMESYFGKLQEQILRITKNAFRAKETDSLGSVLKNWYEEQSSTSKNYLYSTRISNLMSYLSEMDTFDENTIIEKLAKIIVDIFIEDWNSETIHQYELQLKTIRNEIESIKDQEELGDKKNSIAFIDSNGEKVEKFYEKDNDDSTSYFLKNAIEEALDDFGDSLEVNQKVDVLVQTIERLFKS